MVLLCTGLTLELLEILRLYGWRFKVEVNLKQTIHTGGAYANHFKRQDITPSGRGSGNQHVQRQSETFRQHILPQARGLRT